MIANIVIKHNIHVTNEKSFIFSTYFEQSSQTQLVSSYIIIIIFLSCDNYSMINTINSNYRISNQISITTIKITAWSSSNSGSTPSLLIWYLSKHERRFTSQHSIISCNDYSINNHIFSARSRLKLPLDRTNSLLIWLITGATHRWGRR